MATHIRGLSITLSEMNTLPDSDYFEMPSRSAVAHNDLYALAWQSGLFTLNNKGNLHKFTDSAARHYVKGGWLEEYVWLVIEDLCCSYPQSACASDVVVVCESQKNQLDAIVCQPSRALMIECKTINYYKQNFGPKLAWSDLNKLRIVSKRISKEKCDGLLVSMAKVTTNTIERWRSHGVLVLARNGIWNLESSVRHWLEKNSPVLEAENDQAPNPTVNATIS